MEPASSPEDHSAKLTPAILNGLCTIHDSELKSRRSKPASLPKKAQKPLIVFLRLYGTERRRMAAVCARTGLGHNDIGLAGTLAEIARHEAAASPVDPDTARLVGEAVRQGINVRECLKSALRRHIANEAKVA